MSEPPQSLRDSSPKGGAKGSRRPLMSEPPQSLRDSSPKRWSRGLSQTPHERPPSPPTAELPRRGEPRNPPPPAAREPPPEGGRPYVGGAPPIHPAKILTDFCGDPGVEPRVYGHPAPSEASIIHRSSAQARSAKASPHFIMRRPFDLAQDDVFGMSGASLIRSPAPIFRLSRHRCPQ